MAALQKTSPLRAIATVLVPVAVLAAALLLLRNVARFDPSDIAASLASVPAARVASIIAFAAGSYVCLTGFDWMALRYVGRPLPYRKAALASFTALSLGHNIGFAALSSGAIRYRFYSRWGLSTVEVGKVILFCGVTVGLGLATLAGLALLARTDLSSSVTGLAPASARVIGALCLAVPLLYLWAAAVRTAPIRFRQWSLAMPTPKLAVMQIALGATNFALVAACLHQSLNALSDVAYPAVATVYVLANSAAIASHVPGGLGVIEAAVLLLLPGSSSLAAVIVFRLAYFLLPLMLGLITLLASEIVLRRRAKDTELSRRP